MQCSLNGLHFAGKTLRVQCPLHTQRNARRMSHMQGSGYVLTHLATLFSFFETRRNRERKRADTVGTVPVPWADHFQC